MSRQMTVVDLDAVVIVWPKYDHRTTSTCALVDIDSAAECFKKIQFALFNGAVFSLPNGQNIVKEPPWTSLLVKVLLKKKSHVTG